MRQNYTEKDYREILSGSLASSDIVDERIQDTYEIIRNRAKALEKKKKKRKRLIMGMSAAAAVLALSVTVCVADPALAAKIPFIGHIFDTVEKDIGYKGDYSETSEKLIAPEEIKEDGTIDSSYVQKSSGITFTVSECNYESMAMYLAVSVESEQGFSSEFMNYCRYGIPEEPTDADQYVNYSTMYMKSTAEADFSGSGYGKVTFDPAYGASAPYLIEGKFVDDHTFAGIIRVDLVDLQILDDAGEWQQIRDIPDKFSYELHVTSIFAKPGKGEHIEGNWDFALDVELNHENTEVKAVNETNEDGVGIGNVTKTAYELYAELLLPEGTSSADYIVAVCDADGKPLKSQGDIAEIYSVYQRDVSKVYIYVVDYLTYMDECKGDNYGQLPVKALFQTEVEF